MPTEKSFSKGSAFPPLDNGKLRLYSMRFCPFAQRTRLVLAHKGITHETVNINLKDKPDWFLERNPQGMVPVLEKDDRIVYESAICNDFLDESYAGNTLIPADPYQRAQDRMLLDRFGGKGIPSFYKFVRSEGKDEDAKEAYLTILDLLEKEIAKRGSFFGGKAVSMLDFLLWPFFERWVYMKRMCDFTPSQDRFPLITDWIARMYEQPAVIATMFSPEDHIFYVESFITDKLVLTPRSELNGGRLVG